MTNRRIHTGAALVVLLAATGVMTSAPASAQSPENVAVVINDASTVSQRVGDYYVRQRGIPASNVIHIRTTGEESITREGYAATIEAPIGAALYRERLLDRVLYIVLTKGVPLRIEGTGGTNGSVSSVDSELTLLYRKLLGQAPLVPGRVDNPYFLGAKEVQQATRFTHRDYDIYLVSRLDAFTPEEALALIDRAKTPAASGQFVLDGRAPLVNRTGDDWLEMAAKKLGAMGLNERVTLDLSPAGLRDVQNVMGYYSWGSNDPRNRVRSYGMRFVPGAVAATFVSTDGRTFRQPPATWVPTDSEEKSTWFAGTPQSLIGDLIHEGATGVAGHVTEPYLQSTIRPDVLFPAYASGFNLIESFYLAMPHLSWQTIVVGDPLCAPFQRRSLGRGDIEDPSDSTTRLPGLFSNRRVDWLSRQMPAASEAARKLAVRAEAALSGGDVQDARVSLEEASRLASSTPSIELQLALVYDGAGDATKALERYQRVVELDPRNAVALNNLAYALAVKRKSPNEALPLAQRAVVASPNDGTVIDTLAWIQHLLGDDMTAAKTIYQAVRRAPGVAEIRLHAAVINAALGARAVAENELKAALLLNPGFESRDDVKQLRATLAKLNAN